METFRNLLSRIVRHRKYLAFFVFCFLFATRISSAQYSFDQHQDALSQTEGQNLQKFSEQNFAGFVNSFNVALTGCGKPNCPDSLKVGVIGTTGNMIAGMYYNPLASGVVYTADVLQRFNPVQPVYAQVGTGFSSLSPLLSVWKAFRNFAYVFFAIVFVFIGLAIMFRMKMDPRTVLTIQSAIPRIVVALLLVTFSYAIVGFLIDLMYVLMALLILIFQPIVGDSGVTALQARFLTGGFWTALSSIAGVVGAGGGGVVAGIGAVAGLVGGGLLAALSGLAITAPLVASVPAIVFAGGVPALLIGGAGIGAAVFLLILLLIFIYLMFRLFVELLKAYIAIILSLIFGPLIIALGAIPGMPGFGMWFKNLIANILVFPAVAFVLILGQVLTSQGFANGLWSPPLLAGGALESKFIPVLIGFGLLLIVYQIPQMIKNLFGLKGLGFAFGETLGPAAGAGRIGYLGAAETGIRGMEKWATPVGGGPPTGFWAGAANVSRRITGIRGGR